jgi:Homeodomain-like domain-containing protein
MLTSLEAAHFLRHLYSPLALRRCPVARLICEAQREPRHGDQLHAEDITVIQSVATACLQTIENEPRTMRGATQRNRQCAILHRYEVKGEPRESVAADLGISRRQFYRERERALRLYAAVLSDRIQADRSRPNSFSASLLGPLAAQQF